MRIIDTLTVSITGHQESELLLRMPRLMEFLTLSKCVPSDRFPLHCISVKVHVSDLICKLKLNFANVDHQFEYIFSLLQFDEKIIFLHLEIAIDLILDFEQNANLFQAFVLYYQRRFNSKKCIMIKDLRKSLISGFSTRKHDLQIVIYNKTLDVERDNYSYKSDPLTRFEVRIYKIDEIFSLEEFRKQDFRVKKISSSYDDTIFEKIENNLSKNLVNNFKKEKQLYLERTSGNSKFSIKFFLMSQQEFILSKRILRLFYNELKNEDLVTGNFDDYFYKVLQKVSFKVFKNEDLEDFFDLIQSDFL